MTPDEFADAAFEIGRKYNLVDHEVCHVKADELMEEALTVLGYSAGVEIIRHMTRWYA